MRYKVLLLSLFITIINIFPLIADEITPKDFYGEWIVSRYIPASGISAITYDEAKEYEKKIVLYDDNVINFDNDSCSKPQYNINKIDEDTFEFNTYNSFSELEIKSKWLYEVTIKFKTDTPCYLNGSHFFFENKNRLLFTIKGVWFELVRKK